MGTYTTVEKVSNKLGLAPSGWVTLTADSGASETNAEEVNVGAAAIKQFPVGAIVQLAEMTVAKDETTITRTERATVLLTTAALTYFTLTTDLGDDYTTANNGAVRLITPFSEISIPTYDDVDEMILEAEDEIDNRVHTTFKSGGEVFEDYFEFRTSRRYGAYPYITSYQYGSKGTMYKIDFPVDNIKTLATTDDTAYSGYKGDALAIYEGDNWVEWINSDDPLGAGTYTLHTEGREDDFWVDYINGYLFFVEARPARGDWQIHVRFRHGENLFDHATTGSAKRGIAKACRLLVQMELIQNEQYRVTQPGGEGAGRIDPEVLTAKWDAQVTRLLLPHVEPYIFVDEL